MKHFLRRVLHSCVNFSFVWKTLKTTSPSVSPDSLKISNFSYFLMFVCLLTVKQVFFLGDKFSVFSSFILQLIENPTIQHYYPKGIHNLYAGILVTDVKSITRLANRRTFEISVPSVINCEPNLAQEKTSFSQRHPNLTFSYQNLLQKTEA